MLPTSLRAFFALAAVLLFVGGIVALVVLGNGAYIVAVCAAAVFVMPAMFGGRKPSALDLPRIEEQLHRFRSAMLVCFTGAAGIYAYVLTARGRAEWDLLQRLSSLAVALWLVAFVLMFFVAYYRTQRRLAAQ